MPTQGSKRKKLLGAGILPLAAVWSQDKQSACVIVAVFSVGAC